MSDESIRILVVEDHYVVRTTSDELVAAIPKVHQGALYVPADIAEKLARRMDAKNLTPRETVVLEQIVQGRSNKRIASLLDISEATVKTHINSLLNKLGVSDRTQAATAAIRRGIVSLESLRDEMQREMSDPELIVES